MKGGRMRKLRYKLLFIALAVATVLNIFLLFFLSVPNGCL